MLKNILISFVVLLGSTVYAKSLTGEELFNLHCASCHANILGVTNDGGYDNTYITPAPYVDKLVAKLKTKTKTKEEFISFIEDYINEPNKRKSLYGKKAIKEFGLMPSLHGVMSTSEINRLATYLYTDNKKVVKQIKIKPRKVTAGEKLFNRYCAKCHTSVVGVKVTGCDNSDTEFVTDRAPYIRQILIKLKDKTKTKEEFISFIKDYINNPDKRKSLYGKKAIKEFGLMPSLKGAMSDRRATQLAQYLYNYNID
jgi:mono/diheme cytochrome c family protein